MCASSSEHWRNAQERSAQLTGAISDDRGLVRHAARGSHLPGESHFSIDPAAPVLEYEADRRRCLISVTLFRANNLGLAYNQSPVPYHTELNTSNTPDTRNRAIAA